MNYKEQIKSPLWQKRRLEIMERDNFTCQICGCKDKTLNVHHLYYRNNTDIHEYDNQELITICEDCHKEEHSDKTKDLISQIRSLGVTSYELNELLTAFRNCIEGNCLDNPVSVICRIADVFEKHDEEPLKRLYERRRFTFREDIDRTKAKMESDPNYKPYRPEGGPF